MPRMMGVDIPGRKRVEYALRYIHGIGPARAREIVAACKIDAAKHADDLTPDEIRDLTTYIQENYRVEADLRREYAYVLSDLRNMAVLSAGLLAVLLVLSLFI